MRDNDWIAFIGGLVIGCALGGTMVYLVVFKKAQTVIKTFAYDEAGRIMQVMKEYGV